MKKLYISFLCFLIFSVSSYTQCFDCNKNIGGWNGEAAMDIEKLPDGIIYLVASGGFTSGYINKYDFNCNLMWSKTFGYVDVVVQSVTSDPDGNIYLLIRNTTSTNAGLGPWNVGGFMMSPGMNFYKLNPAGDILWTRHIGPGTANRLLKIAFRQNTVYLTGTFYSNLTFSSAVTFSHEYTDYPRAFIAKYDSDGNFINAVEHGNGYESFGVSEVDPQGNTYLTYNTGNYQYSRLDKFNSSLDLAWSDTLTSSAPNAEGSLYNPTGIRFDAENQKLYLWGGMQLTVNIMGHSFFISTSNGIFQSALTEFDSATGALTNIRRFDNSSSNSSPALNGLSVKRSAFMAERNGSLYVLTSFSGTLNFPNGAAVSNTFYNGNYNSEELVLFKVNLSDFTPELLFQSHGLPNLSYEVRDYPGDIVFNGDELYLTASFSSKPLTINGSTINNNSGNNASDAMLYKFNVLNAPSSGAIYVANTCLNDQSNFSLQGSYDDITWNFGESTSTNNVSNFTNPQHQYATTGTYHVTAVVSCSTNAQTITKDITITALPYLNAIPALTSCEDSSGLGISSTFDTSQLNNMLIGTQSGVTLNFSTPSGLALPSPLPNPFINTVANSQSVVVRAFYTLNPSCYVDRTISFTTLPAPPSPTAIAEQNFCTQANAKLSDLVITGQNIKWYDTLNGGNLLTGNPVLQNGHIYYASQSASNCESARIPVLVNIYDTPTPLGDGNQSFCSVQNSTIADIAMSGTSVQWYNSTSGTTPIPAATALIDGTTYYATQTLNGCESILRTAVNVTMIASLNANNFHQSVCDNGNDGIEIVDLMQFPPQLYSDWANGAFQFYETLSDADIGSAVGQILIPQQYNLTTGQQTIFVRILSVNGCFQVVQLTLTLERSPVIISPDTIPLCQNETVSLDAGIGFDSYSWSTGESTHAITVSQAGVYTVTVGFIYDGMTCTAVKSIEATPSSAAVITSITAEDWTDNDNTIIVNYTGSGPYEFSLDGINYQSSNVFTGLPIGKYTVYVRGCGIVTEEVHLMMYPKFFTPNGDGFNDYWSVKFSNDEPGLHVNLFDRYGKLIYQVPYNGSWNGELNGKTLPADDYWFVVTRTNGKEYRGHFSLKR